MKWNNLFEGVNRSFNIYFINYSKAWLYHIGSFWKYFKRLSKSGEIISLNHLEPKIEGRQNVNQDENIICALSIMALYLNKCLTAF